MATKKAENTTAKSNTVKEAKSATAKAAEGETENRKPFMHLLHARMIAQANLLAALTDHPTLIGTGREQALAALLRELIPRRYEVLSGTVLVGGDAKDPKESPQIDIMIVDTLDYPTVLRSGDIAVVLPQSVRVVIEVKSSLPNVNKKDGSVKEGNTFLTAVEQIGCIMSLLEPSVFSALISYSTPKRTGTLRNYLEGTLSEREERYKKLESTRKGKGGDEAEIRRLKKETSWLGAANLPSHIIADDGAIASKISRGAGDGTHAYHYEFLRPKMKGEGEQFAAILSLVDQIILLLGAEVARRSGAEESVAQGFSLLSTTIGPELELDGKCERLIIDDPEPSLHDGDVETGGGI